MVHVSRHFFLRLKGLQKKKKFSENQNTHLISNTFFFRKSFHLRHNYKNGTDTESKATAI